LSQQATARRHGISVTTLRRWLAGDGVDVGAPPRLLPVRVRTEDPAPQVVTVMSPSGVEIRVRAGTDPAYVVALARALG
jgi:hypothetical protein